jgi:putative ABC transport system permease protein
MSSLSLRSTWNHLVNNKFHTILNIFGLATGLVFFIHLFIYISYEYGYEGHIKARDRIFRVNYDITSGGEKVIHSAKTPRRLFRVLKEEVPGIEYTALAYVEDVLVRYENKLYSDQSDLWVEGDFAEMFELEMVKGRARLNDAFFCIISESKAREIFGNEDPVGKLLYVNQGMKHEISGVYKDLPSNSHIHFDYFMPIRTWVMIEGIPREETFSGSDWWTYIKIKEGADIKEIEKGLDETAAKYLTALKRQNRTGKFSLQPLSELHFSTDRVGELGTTMRKKTFEALVLIAILVLVVIWMNYVNLSTALARKRLNVFAIYRKMGASGFSLLKMSLIESAIVNSAAILLALAVWVLTRSFFSRLIGIPISDGYLNYPKISIIISLILAAGIALTATMSSIPALRVNLVSDQRKRDWRNNGSFWLVGLQFFISCFLIMCTLMVTRQIRFMQKADLGVDLGQVIVLKGAASTHTDSLRREHFNAFRDDVLKVSEFRSGSASMNAPGQAVRYRRSNLSLPEKPGELKTEITLGNIDDGFIETYGLKLLAGRNFEQPISNDYRRVIISESVSNLLGFGSPGEAVNRQLRMGNDLYTIKGVVNDFHHESLKKTSEPIIFIHRHPSEFGYYSFRIQGNVDRAVAHIRNVWPRHYPNDPLNYFFSNDYFNEQYNEEIRLSRILGAFTIFAIIVASLGLYGLISFVAEQKTKEIGLRKVNGAEVSDILRLMLSCFIRFEAAAFLLAAPLAWLVMNRWLRGFAYQASIAWWIFALTGAIAFVISVLSTIAQSYRAATRNPVEALRYE